MRNSYGHIDFNLGELQQAKLHAYASLSALPSTNRTGRIVYTADTEQFYRGTGTSWIPLITGAFDVVSNVEDLPEDPDTGAAYIVLGTDGTVATSIFIWDGSNWVNITESTNAVTGYKLTAGDSALDYTNLINDDEKELRKFVIDCDCTVELTITMEAGIRNGDTLIVKTRAGAATYPVTLEFSGIPKLDNIAGAATYEISTPNATVKLSYSSTFSSWFIESEL